MDGYGFFNNYIVIRQKNLDYIEISFKFLRARITSISFLYLIYKRCIVYSPKSTSYIPYERFYLTLKSHESKRQDPKRLQKFLDSLEIEGSTIEEKCLKYYNLIKKGQMKKLKI